MTRPSRREIRKFGFWFLVCYAATQLATPLQQIRIQIRDFNVTTTFLCIKFPPPILFLPVVSPVSVQLRIN